MWLGPDDGAVETGRGEQPRDGVTEVAGGVGVMLDPARSQAVGAADLTTDIYDVESATGPQHPEQLRRGRYLGVLVEVMQHHRRQGSVELTSLERQVLRVGAFEPNTGHA